MMMNSSLTTTAPTPLAYGTDKDEHILMGKSQSVIWGNPASNIKMRQSSYLVQLLSDANSYTSVVQEADSSLSERETLTEYEKYLDERKEIFIGLLKITDFEDGMDNEPIREARLYWQEDENATIYWFRDIFNTSKNDNDVLSGLLRVVGSVAWKEPIGLLMPMFEEGLQRDSSKVQEAAIMLAEEWRTRECLKALQSATYQSEWMEEYARMVEEELKQELEK